MTTPTLLSRLDAWERHADDPERRPGDAVALLCAAEQAGPRTPAPAWHRFLDATRRPRFLQSLPGRSERERWAAAAFGGVRAARYTLAAMLGQRVGEQSLDSLARQVAAGRARIVTEEKSRLVDRAWSAVMGALGQLVGHNSPSEAHA